MKASQLLTYLVRFRNNLEIAKQQMSNLVIQEAIDSVDQLTCGVVRDVWQIHTQRLECDRV